MLKVEYAKLSDARILGEIHAASWKGAYKGILPDEILKNINADKREQYFHKAITEERGKNAIIYIDDVPAGLICIGKCRDEDRNDEYGEIWGIYLKPDYWNMGIGSVLIKWGMGELMNQGFSKVSLWVLKNNDSAILFYEKIGFHHDGTEKEITIGRRLTEIRYEIPLI